MVGPLVETGCRTYGKMRKLSFRLWRYGAGTRHIAFFRRRKKQNEGSSGITSTLSGLIETHERGAYVHILEVRHESRTYVSHFWS